MKGSEVYEILGNIKVTHLHHANSVTTSCTFLEQGGLGSRGFVEDNGLKQTPQSSDEKDKRYGIWHRVFVDNVDIHERAGPVRGPNEYGPVLFVLDRDVLLELPTDSEVAVTKQNPCYWYDNQPDSERWFESVGELAAGLEKGEFAQMLVIKTPTGKLDFPNGKARIILDDPQRQLSFAENAYTHAEGQLKKAAIAGGVEVSIARRVCSNACTCVQKYATWGANRVDLYFT